MCITNEVHLQFCLIKKVQGLVKTKTRKKTNLK